MTNNEILLNALIDGETVDIVPKSRAEAYLKACCNCTGADNLPKPKSRNDKLLLELAEKLHGGSYTNLLKGENVLLNQRISSSSSSPVTAYGYVTIKNIPVSSGEIKIRFRGLRNKDDGYIVLSNAEDTFTSFIYDAALSVDTNGDAMFTVLNDNYSFCSITLSWFFNSAEITADDISNSIVTINEPIQ